MYKRLFDGLRTTFTAAPRVIFDAPDERPRVTMHFAVSPIVEGRWCSAELAFDQVVDFHFYDFEIGLPFSDADDLEFGLIECVNSTLISKFAITGALERTVQPMVSVGDLRHLRIAFDDHGVYDIVCLGVSLRTAPSAATSDGSIDSFEDS